ncbi:hypothetical protein [Klebsiella michiganensis]|uniref:hypothetical protein n=1 Tax=Klebsiella michiganensis TaxID=1134687 RepID=UPI0012B77820|nr:hypothetical protein [Klebsiella michiganensis]
MNISTVNELIQSLESAGELSIKETKVMALAKAFKQLAAENVRLAAENKMAADAVTVFSNVTHDVTEIICDELGHDRVAEIVAAYNDLGNTPATDRIFAEAEARGVEKFAAKLRIPGDDQFFDAVAEGVAGAADAFAKQLREGADK